MVAALGAPRARAAARRAAGLVAVALSALVYWRVARAFFYADDFVHLLTIVERGVGAFVVQLYAGHLYLVRNLIFGLTWKLSGLDPRPYYCTALVTHLVNVWLVYRVARVLADDSAVLGALAAAVWG